MSDGMTVSAGAVTVEYSNVDHRPLALMLLLLLEGEGASVESGNLIIALPPHNLFDGSPFHVNAEEVEINSAYGKVDVEAKVLVGALWGKVKNFGLKTGILK